MNYRDILLFPKFENIDSIQNIRKECDNLYKVISPHITIVFPFIDEISDEELINEVTNLLKDKNKFKIKFNNTSISHDNYIFLNCIEGNKEIIDLHDTIYNNLLNKHLKDIEYIPHITLGQLENLKDKELINNFNETFETIIEEVYIEKIGENDKSIIIGNIKLNN